MIHSIFWITLWMFLVKLNIKMKQEHLSENLYFVFTLFFHFIYLFFFSVCFRNWVTGVQLQIAGLLRVPELTKDRSYCCINHFVNKISCQTVGKSCVQGPPWTLRVVVFAQLQKLTSHETSASNKESSSMRWNNLLSFAVSVSVLWASPVQIQPVTYVCQVRLSWRGHMFYSRRQQGAWTWMRARFDHPLHEDRNRRFLFPLFSRRTVKECSDAPAQWFYSLDVSVWFQQLWKSWCLVAVDHCKYTEPSQEQYDTAQMFYCSSAASWETSHRTYKLSDQIHDHLRCLRCCSCDGYTPTEATHLNLFQFIWDLFQSTSFF